MAKYVEILFRFKFRFVLLLLVLPALVGAVTILLYPSYLATAQLWVDDPSYFGGNTPSGWSQYLSPAQNEADSLNQLLHTRTFGDDLYQSLNDSIPDPGARVRAVNASKVTVAAAGTHLMVVTATCDQPPTCEVVLSKAVEVLRNEQIQNEKNNAAAGVTFITARLQQAKASQATAEDALRRYIALHPGTKIDQDPSTIADPDLAKIASDVQQWRGQVSNLQDQLNRNSNIVSTSTALIQSGPRMIDKPKVAAAGVLGDRSSLRRAAMTGGAALLLGVAYLFLLGWLDKTLRDPRDIEHRFKVPVVTTIPELQLTERF